MSVQIKWTDVDPETGVRRFLCVNKFAGQWWFKWKLQRRGEWTRGLEPTLEMWPIMIVLLSPSEICAKRIGGRLLR